MISNTRHRINKAIQKMEVNFPFPNYTLINRKSYNYIASTIIRYLSPGSKILDFGSGPADKAVVLSDLGYNCVCLDDLNDDWHHQDDNINKILSFAKNSNIEFVIKNDDVLPFSSGSFDLIMMNDVIEHLHDSPAKIIEDLLKLLRPNGYLLITTPNLVNLRKRIDVILGKTNLPNFRSFYFYPGKWRGHVREYVKSDFIELCEYAGLSVIELRNYHFMIDKLNYLLRWPYVFFTFLIPNTRDTWLLFAQKRG